MKIKCQADNPANTIFDDLLFLSMLIMEKAFYGEYSYKIQHQLESKKEKKTKNSSSLESFENSVFYQELVNDSVNNSLVYSSVNLKRAADRLLNMPIYNYGNVKLIKKIMIHLESIGVDKQVINNSRLYQQIKLKGREGSLIIHIKHARTQSDRLVLNGMGNESAVSKLKRSFSTRTNSYQNDDLLKKQNTKNNYNYSIEEDLSINHVFVKCTDKRFTKCECCFDEKIINKKEYKSLYQCETCSMVVHKCCRNYVLFDCIDVSKAVNEQYEGEDSEKIKKIQDRISAINNEILLEENILNGAKKVIEVSGKNSNEQNSIAILEKSQKKIDALKKELNKNEMFLEKLQNEEKLKNNETNDNNNVLLSFNSDSVTTEVNVKYIDDTDESKEIKIMISKLSTTKGIILELMKKLELDGKCSDYSLSYLSSRNNFMGMSSLFIMTQIFKKCYFDNYFKLNKIK